MPDLKTITTPVSVPDFTHEKAAIAPLLATAESLLITNVDEQARALELLRDIRANIKTASAKFKSIKDPMNAAKNAVLAWEHEVIDPWKEMEERLSKANSAFMLFQQEEADRKAREERERLQAIADERARAEQADREAQATERATELELAGDELGAMNVIENVIASPVAAVEIPTFTKPAEVARVAGVSSRASYSASVVDMRALIEYCLTSDALIEMYLLPNATALNQRARTLKEGFNVPGCKLEKKYV